MIELQEDNLSRELQENDRVVVQYGASWCGNCRMVRPKFGKLAEGHPGIRFIYVDAERFPQSRSHASVTNLPTFAAFEGGVLVAQNQGNRIELVEELVRGLEGEGV